DRGGEQPLPKARHNPKTSKGASTLPPPYPPPQAGEGKGRDNSHQTMVCPNCQAENRPGRKFCAQCGSALAAACPSCGAANQPGERFCGECGIALTGEPAFRAAAGQPAIPPAAERRLVSVLFADLVGFTSLSDPRDPGDVRDLLTRYFETSR